MTEEPVRKKKPELKVVFDSNVLYTGTASDLVSQSVAQLITESRNHQDIALMWYIPEIVIFERKYQMCKKGLELLPHIQKLEQLLGHQLNITAEIIQSRVEDAIQKQLSQLGLLPIKLATDRVDWARMIHASAFRVAPFDPGEKEKGFRDAILAETFQQLVEDSPSTPRVCRIALTTGDGLLATAVSERATGSANVRIVKSLDELKSLINTLVSSVSEEVVARIKEQASSYFFVPKDESTLYYTEKVGIRIMEKFKKELDEVPKGADRRENGTWYISPPGFVKKEGQRVTWNSPVEEEAKAFKREPTSAGIAPPPDILATGLFAGLPPPSGQSSQPKLGIDPSAINWSDIFLDSRPEKLAAQGRSQFEVVWSHLISTNGKIRSPRIDDIRFVKTNWESK